MSCAPAATPQNCDAGAAFHLRAIDIAMQPFDGPAPCVSSGRDPTQAAAAPMVAPEDVWARHNQNGTTNMSAPHSTDEHEHDLPPHHQVEVCVRQFLEECFQFTELLAGKHSSAPKLVFSGRWGLAGDVGESSGPDEVATSSDPSYAGEMALIVSDSLPGTEGSGIDACPGEESLISETRQLLAPEVDACAASPLGREIPTQQAEGDQLSQHRQREVAAAAAAAATARAAVSAVLAAAAARDREARLLCLAAEREALFVALMTGRTSCLESLATDDGAHAESLKEIAIALRASDDEALRRSLLRAGHAWLVELLPDIRVGRHALVAALSDTGHTNSQQLTPPSTPPLDVPPHDVPPLDIDMPPHGHDVGWQQHHERRSAQAVWLDRVIEGSLAADTDVASPKGDGSSSSGSKARRQSSFEFFKDRARRLARSADEMSTFHLDWTPGGARKNAPANREAILRSRQAREQLRV